MADLDVLAFVVWGGGLFNVGFFAGWFAGRRMLRQSNSETKGWVFQGRGPVPAQDPDLLMPGSDFRLTLESESVQAAGEGEEPPMVAQLSKQKSVVWEEA